MKKFMIFNELVKLLKKYLMIIDMMKIYVDNDILIYINNKKRENNKFLLLIIY